MLVLPEMILPFLFLFSHIHFFGGVFHFLFTSIFSLLFPCLSSLSSPSLTSLSQAAVLCYPLSCTWLSPGMVFTNQGGDFVNMGAHQPLPPSASHGTNARAGVAMARSSLEGESFCRSRQDSSYIAATWEERALAEGRAVVLLMVQRGVLVQWVWVTVGVKHAYIKQRFLPKALAV